MSVKRKEKKTILSAVISIFTKFIRKAQYTSRVTEQMTFLHGLTADLYALSFLTQVYTDITNCTQQRSSREVSSHTAIQEIFLLWWNLKIHCRVQEDHCLTLSRTVCLQSTPSCPVSLWVILILSSHLHLRFSRDFFSSGFLTKFFYVTLICPTHTTSVKKLK